MTQNPRDTDVIYRGHPDGHTVTIERPRSGHLCLTEPLPHQVKHSPGGFSWGYGGSGPAELARSLLINALGGRDRCPVCEGAGEVVYDLETNEELPVHRGATPTGDDPSPSRFSTAMPCLACENGCAVIPTMYQAFKFDVIARLPEHGWTLRRSDVLAWVQRHRAGQPA